LNTEIDKSVKGYVAVISFRDSGCGISEDRLKDIFNSFFSDNKDKNNLGLGLSISQQIVRMHNGEITVESKEGVGTTFKIRIPLK